MLGISCEDCQLLALLAQSHAGQSFNLRMQSLNTKDPGGGQQEHSAYLP